MRFVVRNVFSELLAGYNARITEIGGAAYALLCFPGGEEGMAALADTIRRGIQILQDNFDLSLTIAVSGSLQGLNRVSQAFAWARDTLSAAQPGSGETRLQWEQPAPLTPPDRLTVKAEALLRRLEQSASAGDLMNTKEQLALFQDAAALLPGWAVRLQCAAFLQNLLQNISLRFSPEESKSAISLCQAYAEAGHDFPRFSRAIEAVCALCDASGENARRADIARRADEFIQAHFGGSSLSVSRIAEHLDLTYSYASALYKHQKGQAMLDIINLTRITYAKRLLANTHMSLDQAAEKSGYYNNSSFICAFKRYEGITPGQYRSAQVRGNGEAGMMGSNGKEAF